ncbi:MAG TPA: hypothetical protein ENK17_03185 [Anaerolineae bacterium]|nr:hypothetical protein [Anaerolineae bacterium]
MTSPREPRLLDDLGRRVQRALQERTAAGPPPQTWERIRARAERETALTRNLRAFLRSMCVWLAVDTGFSLGVAAQRDMLGVWRDLSWVYGRHRSQLALELAF